MEPICQFCYQPSTEQFCSAQHKSRYETMERFWANPRKYEAWTCFPCMGSPTVPNNKAFTCPGQWGCIRHNRPRPPIYRDLAQEYEKKKMVHHLVQYLQKLPTQGIKDCHNIMNLCYYISRCPRPAVRTIIEFI